MTSIYIDLVVDSPPRDGCRIVAIPYRRGAPGKGVNETAEVFVRALVSAALTEIGRQTLPPLADGFFLVYLRYTGGELAADAVWLGQAI